MSSNSEIVLTHSQAACVFYRQDITPENEILNDAKIDAMHELELCYINNTPSEPFLVSAGRIKYFSFRYNRYRRSIKSSCASTIANGKDVTQVNNQVVHRQSQLKKFVYNVFLSIDPDNEKVYERSELSSEQVFRITSQYTTLYKNKDLGNFTNFARKIKAGYLKADISRKRSKDGRIQRKILYVMKPNDRAQSINNYQYRYEEFIKNLKMDGFDVIGYARKSPTKISDDELKGTIKNMISCFAILFSSHRRACGTKYLLQKPHCRKRYDNRLYEDKRLRWKHTIFVDVLYVTSTTKKICLVIVDYADLSTDPDD